MSQVLQFNTSSDQPISDPAKSCMVFSNPGVLDINLVKLLGVSVKETDSPIGFFGTGLKYAMATTLRLRGSITLYLDGERYDVAGIPITIRGKEFMQVTLNGEPLGFTTELGKQWEAWMVVRELYSNALDENGDVTIRIDADELTGAEAETLIILRGDCFLEVWDNRHDYFIAKDENPYHESPSADAFSCPSCVQGVFYRGIRIWQSIKPFVHRYNIKDNVELTEDRTLKYQWQMKEAIEKSIITSKDRTYIERVLLCGESHFETELSFTESYPTLTMSDEFAIVCSRLAERNPKDANKGVIRWYKKRTQYIVPMRKASLTKVQEKQLQKAIDCVKSLGFVAELERYPIEVMNFLGENVHGKAENGKILVSKDCFDKGTKYLASTILEEFVHNHYGLCDESRALEMWLFDRIITMAEEHILGEPV